MLPPSVNRSKLGLRPISLLDEGRNHNRGRCAVFCPNCGTPNPETAQAYSKCAFVLKNAAAPKFKGTMLMVNPATGPAGQSPRTPLPPTPDALPGVPRCRAQRARCGVQRRFPTNQGNDGRRGAAHPGWAWSAVPWRRTSSAGEPARADAMAFGGGATLAFSPGAPKDSPQVGSPQAYSPPDPRAAYVPSEPRAPVNPLGGTVAADAVAYAAAFASHPAAGPPGASGPAHGPGAAPSPGGGKR